MNKIVVSLSSLVIGLILVFVIIDPLWSSVGILRERVSSKKQEITKIEVLLSKKQELEKKYQEAQQDADRVFLSLPKGEDTSYLISQFSNMASRNGLLMESVTFERSVKKGSEEPEKKTFGFSTLAVDLKLSGTYSAFKGYLKDIEEGLRLIEVASIEFSPQRGTLSLGLFEFRIKTNAYYQ